MNASPLTLRSWLRLLPLLAFVLICVPERQAQAGRGIMLITSGDSITHVADLDPEAAKTLDAELGPGVAVGYKYEQFGLFFVEVWSWNGEFVLFRDDEYWDVDDEVLAAAAGVSSVSELSKPLTYTVPPGLVVIALLVVGFVVFKLMDKGDDEAHASEQAVGEIANDPRYQQAVQVYAQNHEWPEEQRLQSAVSQLGQHGIPEAEARANLMALLEYGGAAPGQGGGHQGATPPQGPGGHA